MKPTFTLPLTFTIILLSIITLPLRGQTETQQVMTVLNDFFTAVNTSDSAAFNKVFFKDAHMFISRSVNDSTVYASRPAVKTSIFKPGVQYRETMRDKGVKVEVHQHIAMAWVPYDFYVNNTFSHCGIDVFTLMKTTKGWKIVLIAYSVEKTGCDEW